MRRDATRPDAFTLHTESGGALFPGPQTAQTPVPTYRPSAGREEQVRAAVFPGQGPNYSPRDSACGHGDVGPRTRRARLGPASSLSVSPPSPPPPPPPTSPSPPRRRQLLQHAPRRLDVYAPPTANTHRAPPWAARRASRSGCDLAQTRGRMRSSVFGLDSPRAPSRAGGLHSGVGGRRAAWMARRGGAAYVVRRRWRRRRGIVCCGQSVSVGDCVRDEEESHRHTVNAPDAALDMDDPLQRRPATFAPSNPASSP
ncbi:hypothetical protein CERSUDRAFT_96267 [Gelatoporia subvermispora B]|uniref:Uncharacterized protein n=1 Tax=Ceriporiopsis subvermispora (strain B) TaxID=914234 RepID=M2QG79_CERS8|nr:hypothetical protein CERSUDRAFT_96267 [Gelatoporia subvermispora B]